MECWLFCLVCATLQSMPSSRSESRQYVRIPSIVPVDFLLRDKSGEVLDPEIRTAFTRDLSQAGMCLEVHHAPPRVTEYFNAPTSELAIEVDIDLPTKVLRVPGRIAWRRPALQQGTGQGWLLGVEFAEVAPADAQAIAAYARSAALKPRLVRGALAALVLLSGLAFGLYVWQGKKLTADLEDSRHKLEKTEQQYVQASDQLGDRQVELRWVAVQLRDLADELDAKQGRQPQKSGGAASVVDDLKDSAKRLGVALSPGE